MLSLNGKVENLRKDEKDAMHITVGGKEYNILHYWPKLQLNIAIGDSVIKRSKDTVIVLFKVGSGERISCNFSQK